MFEYNYNKINFKCHETMDGNKILLYDGHPLNFLDGNYFSFQDPTLPFNENKNDIEFSPEIKEICFMFFDTVKKMYEDGIEERPSSILVATLFEKFAGYWKNTLLCHHREKIGIKFWKKVLGYVKEWKLNNPNVFIHTGTPYYFLSENYFLLGDYDSAFTYLHNAIQIDKQSWQWNYEGHIGAYSLAKMIDDPRTQMNYLTQNIRIELNKYIEKFNNEYDSFTIHEFDRKFLKNEDKYDVIGYFFTVTFYTIIHNHRNSILETNENYFSKVRSLDMIFNLCIIIDKILKKRFFRENESSDISQGITKLFETNQWINYRELNLNWKNQGKFNESKPEISIPIFLTKQERYGDNTLPKGAYVLLLAHYCRNLGAHTLNDKSVFVEKHDEIVNDLMMALFCGVKSIAY